MISLTDSGAFKQVWRISYCWQVLNEANLTNAILVRSVLTRSDLGGAIIEGADFSDAVIDLPQKQVHKYLNSNTITHMILSVYVHEFEIPSDMF